MSGEQPAEFAGSIEACDHRCCHHSTAPHTHDRKPGECSGCGHRDYDVPLFGVADVDGSAL